MDVDSDIVEAKNAYANIFLFGASGFAYAMSLVLQRGIAANPHCHVAGFIDDDQGGRGGLLQGKPVLSVDEWRQRHGSSPILVSVGAPTARRKIVERLSAAEARFANLYEDLKASLFLGVEIGSGSFIGPMTYVGPLTSIGDHTQIMSNCSIGHDVTIGAFCTVCPSCTISGYVILEPGVFLGAGTTIVNGTLRAPIRIGRGAKIAAGSVVTKSVPEGAKVSGNPARPLREIALQRSYAVTPGTGAPTVAQHSAG
jgi:sugar O-acyltransferase (sialic acid O-acetyltransferase NeuD family)